MDLRWLLLFIPLVAAQSVPIDPAIEELDPVVEEADKLVGDEVPPALDAAYDAAGQNITREDVRIRFDLNITKGKIGVLDMVLGGGKAIVEAQVQVRVEMRVISTERVRAAIQGDNPFAAQTENATFLSKMYLPAEVFRATLAAEVIASFQEEQEVALEAWLRAMIPELEVDGVEVAWFNTSPLAATTDGSLKEPPIIMTMEATVRYEREESLVGLLSHYMETRDEPDSPKRKYLKELKEENSDPLRARDFFAAAAYSQLLNISMQPGWSLDVWVNLPPGYSIEYANHEVDVDGKRTATFTLDGGTSDQPVRDVFVVSLTHRRGVMTVLLAAMVVVGGVLAAPGHFLYGRRIRRLSKESDS